MAVKKVGGRTIYTEDGYLPEDVVKALYKRLAEEEAKGKRPASKSAKKPAQKPSKKSK